MVEFKHHSSSLVRCIGFMSSDFWMRSLTFQSGSDICCIMHRYGKRTIWCENVKAAADAKACKVLLYLSSNLRLNHQRAARAYFGLPGPPRAARARCTRWSRSRRRRGRWGGRPGRIQSSLVKVTSELSPLKQHRFCPRSDGSPCRSCSAAASQ